MPPSWRKAAFLARQFQASDALEELPSGLEWTCLGGFKSRKSLFRAAGGSGQKSGARRFPHGRLLPASLARWPERAWQPGPRVSRSTASRFGRLQAHVSQAPQGENWKPQAQADSATSSNISGGAWASASGSWVGSEVEDEGHEVDIADSQS